MGEGELELLTFLTILARFIDPSIHASFGRRGCSPQGFVDSIIPKRGVGLSLFILSINISPGSPVSHADCIICSNTSPAFFVLTTLPVLGLSNSYSPSLSRASIKVSVIATDILKFASSLWSLFTVMKSIMSGWSILRIPIFAPRLAPPCFITSVAVLNTFINDTGPLAMPPVDITLSLLGLNLEKEKPVPPPDWRIRAAFFRDSKILTMESSTGRTKQAASWPSSLPAFIRVGLFGRNSRLPIRL